MWPTKILRYPYQSPLIVDLLLILPSMIQRRTHKKYWLGFILTDPISHGLYAHIRYRPHLYRTPKKAYSIALHLFEKQENGFSMHNHRKAIAVYPFADDGTNDVLYNMPWQQQTATGDILDSGVCAISPGCSYAIHDHRYLYHQVYSQRKHWSISISNDYDPPTRENRMLFREMKRAQTHEILTQARNALSKSPIFSHQSTTPGAES